MHQKHHHHREGAVLDWLGLGLSGLCAVHCLLLPLVLSLLPFIDWGVSDQTFHVILAAAILPLGAFAFWRGYRFHRRKDIFWLGLVGMLAITLGLMVQPDHEHAVSAFTWSLPLTVLGSFALIGAHYRNWRHSKCRSCGSVEP